MGYFHTIAIKYFERLFLVYKTWKDSYKFSDNFSLLHSFASLSIDQEIRSFMKPVTFYQYLSKKLKVKGVFIPDLLNN